MHDYDPKWARQEKQRRKKEQKRLERGRKKHGEPHDLESRFEDYTR